MMAAGIEPAFSGWLAAGRGIVEPMATHRMAASDLDLGLLRTFLTLVSSGSLGKTAASIDKTQSAVSQQMLRLEKILGQKLFTRGRDGITLTQPRRVAGDLLQASCRAPRRNAGTIPRRERGWTSGIGHKQLCCADRVRCRDAAPSGISSGHGVAGGNGGTCQA